MRVDYLYKVYVCIEIYSYISGYACISCVRPVISFRRHETHVSSLVLSGSFLEPTHPHHNGSCSPPKTVNGALIQYRLLETLETWLGAFFFESGMGLVCVTTNVTSLAVSDP